jgi:uncharacterized membrane protein (GlpM family)
MDTLLLKLVLTPALIGAASLAGRRWGQSIGGWLVGLPLTAGPVAFFIALDHGAQAAAAAALGSLAGAAVESCFGPAYAWTARRGPWPLAFAAGTLAFAVGGYLVQRLQIIALGPLPIFLGVIGVLLLMLRLMPGHGTAGPAATLPRWDIPARMAVATAVVVALTAAASYLGAALTGMLATFPIYAGTLTVFAHHLEGGRAAARVLRGLLYGLFSLASFFVTLALLIGRLGIAPAFLGAIAASLLAQGISLVVMQRAARRAARS